MLLSRNENSQKIKHREHTIIIIIISISTCLEINITVKYAKEAHP